MNGSIDDEMVLDLARAQVTQLVPQELPLFRAQSAAYLSNPEQALQPARARGDLLGFGAEAAVVFLTPIILDVSKTVLGFVAAEVRKSLREESPAFIQNVIRSLFKRVAPGNGKTDAVKEPGSGGNAEAASGPSGAGETTVGHASPFTLSAQQLRELRRTAFERAKQLQLPDDRAALLADSLVGSLVTA